MTVYKKTDETYMLKMKNSREFFSNVQKKYGTMPFTLRSMENETKAKMGVVECVTHRLIEPFQVLYEKDGEYVAQFKFTVLLMPNGPHKITGLPFDPAILETDKKIEDLDVQVNLIEKYRFFTFHFNSNKANDLNPRFTRFPYLIVALLIFRNC